MDYPKLLEGFGKFHKKFFTGRAKDKALFKTLVKDGQNPSTLVIACSDSRIDPAILTQSNPGDIFVVRNVAAIVPPYQPDSHYHGTSAAIEYAVKALKVENIIIFGHSQCGGVNALSQCCCECGRSEALEGFDFILPWVSIGQDAKQHVDTLCTDYPADKKTALLEQAVIIQSLKNLLTFPWVCDKYLDGKLALHGWYFHMEKGQLLTYSPSEHNFIGYDAGLKKTASPSDSDFDIVAFVQKQTKTR